MTEQFLEVVGLVEHLDCKDIHSYMYVYVNMHTCRFIQLEMQVENAILPQSSYTYDLFAVKLV